MASRGVIKPSYKARAFKGSGAMYGNYENISKGLVVPNHSEYKKYSNLFFEFLKTYTNRV